MKKRVYILLVATVCILGGGMYALYPSAEYQQNLEQLKQSCAELTRNDSQGRVYEPIVGRYLGSKSYTGFVPSNVYPQFRWNNMFLKNHFRVFEVGASYTKDQESNLQDVLKKVVGDDTLGQSIDTDHYVGLCGTKFKKDDVLLDKYLGSIETFRRMEN